MTSVGIEEATKDVNNVPGKEFCNINYFILKKVTIYVIMFVFG